MDIISSLNSAFTQVQRSENLSFSSNGNNNQVGYRERESSNSVSGQFGGANRGMQNFLPDSFGGPMRAAVHNVVDYDRSEGGTLQLRTQEGDTVKLKFLNSESMNAQNQQFEGGGSVLSGFSMSGSNSSQFSVVVEGDLSGEELSAIRDVLIQAREMSNTFYDGEVKQAFSMASQFNVDSEQLANVNMQLNVTENYTYSSAVLEAQNGQDPVTPPSETTMPISPVVASVPPAASPNIQSNTAAIAVPVLQSNLTATAPASQPNVSQLTQEAPSTPVPLETPVHSEPDPVDHLNGALSTITSFLNQLTSSMNSINQQFQGQNSSPAFAFSGGFQLQVVSAMVGQMESQLEQEQASPSGHSLASATIDLVAMRMDAHVDAMI